MCGLVSLLGVAHMQNFCICYYVYDYSGNFYFALSNGIAEINVRLSLDFPY